jgi:hypothetical protein
MKINIEPCREEVQLFINGELKLELTGELLTGPKDLLKEVTQARMLQALPKILRMLPKALARQGADSSAVIRGFCDGLSLARVDHPMPGVPSIRPDHSPSYSEGYSIGEAVAKIQTHFEE